MPKIVSLLALVLLAVIAVLNASTPKVTFGPGPAPAPHCPQQCM